MGFVADYLGAWRGEVAPYGLSQPFETMDLTVIERLEDRAPTCPVSRALIAVLDDAANRLRRVTDFDEWLPVYEAYAEAKVGLLLLDTGLPVERITPPAGEQRPDFKIAVGEQDYFIEVKTLHARYGAAGYRRSMEDTFETLVSMDERYGTHNVVTGETVVQPHRTPGDRAYDPWSNRQIIETLIGRADGHIKPGQFAQGTTVFALELSLLPLRSSLREELYRAYPCPHEVVATSGILWHLAFGPEGADVYRPVEFTGASNLDGQLEAVGLIHGGRHPDVRGIWVFSGADCGWLVPGSDENLVAPLLGALHGPANNEGNELWCRQHLEPGEAADLKAMVEIKAFELWDERIRNGQPGTALSDWLAAKAALGVPPCAPV